jgi:hypothetical protein
MKELLGRIERQLMDGIERHVARRRARRRALVAAAVLGGLLMLASVASAVTGVGPAGGLFDADEAIPPSAEPVPGGRRAQLHAGGQGASGWDLLFYRAEPPRLSPGYPRRFCIALARSDSKAIPRGGIEGPVDPSDVYGGSTACEHPLTLVARLLRERLEVGGDSGAAYIAGPQRPPTAPFHGLVLGDAERVTLTRTGEPPVEAELSRPFRIRTPRLTPRLLRDLNPRQRRMAADLPRLVELRAFLGVAAAPEVPVGQRIPVVTIRAEFENGDSVTRTSGGELVGPQPKPDPHALDPRPGGRIARLYAGAPGGKRWRAVGYETRDRALCAGIALLPTDRRWERLSCGSGMGMISPLARGGLRQEVSTNRPDRARSHYALYGLTRGDARSLVFESRGGRIVRARLSPVWTVLRQATGPRRIGVRLYLAVAPPGTGVLEPRLTLRDGRVLDGRP